MRKGWIMSSDVYIKIGTNVQSLVHVSRSRELSLRCDFFSFSWGGLLSNVSRSRAVGASLGKQARVERDLKEWITEALICFNGEDGS